MAKNFGALSCEPCKTFFRRNAMKTDIKCQYYDNCIIDEKSRKFCAKCRLEKCLRVGMKRDWMNSADEIKGKKSDNQRKRHTKSSKTSDPSINTSKNSDPLENQDFFHGLLDDNSFSDIQLNQQIYEIENSLTSDSSKSSNDIQNNEVNSCIPNDELDVRHEIPIDIKDEVMRKAVEFELAVIPIARPVAEYKCDFNATEIHILREIMQSIKYIEIREKGRRVEIKNNVEFVVNFADIFDAEIRRITKCVKGMNDFQKFDESDQISMIKYGCFEAMYLRSIIHFDHQDKVLVLPTDRNVTLVLKMDFLRNKLKVYDFYEQYIHKISPIWDSDRLDLKLNVRKCMQQTMAQVVLRKLRTTAHNI
ncbi:unnamed protein product [Oppiella nova]|uniref:Nuclear receptor domain-containing protein n=1 Tax=Oppiella nova TaxID=334625 RepID=A0A7R9LHK4_9ACAR|nr:unnamed protein product [Oppiella nova]CAG2163688.1 unnamed protein product [Oppiella nova]